MNSLGTSNARIKISPAVISRTEMPVTVLDLAVKVFPFFGTVQQAGTTGYCQIRNWIFVENRGILSGNAFIGA